MATPQLPLFTKVNNDRAGEVAMRSIPIYFQGETYFLESITGSLLRRPARPGDESVPKTDAIADARLREVDDPFLLKERKAGDLPDRIPRRVRLYAALLTWLCRHSFPLALLVYGRQSPCTATPMPVWPPRSTTDYTRESSRRISVCPGHSLHAVHLSDFVVTAQCL